MQSVKIYNSAELVEKLTTLERFPATCVRLADNVSVEVANLEGADMVARLLFEGGNTCVQIVAP